MASLFSFTKRVLPRQIIKSEDFNALSSATLEGFDRIGAQAPDGETGVDSTFYVKPPTANNHAVTKKYLEDTAPLIIAPQVTAVDEDAALVATSLATIVAAEDNVEALAAQVATDRTTVDTKTTQVSADAAQVATDRTAVASNTSQVSTDAAQVATDRVQVEAAAGAVTNENLLINGGFEIWQRGTSVVCANIVTYTADRWFGFNCTIAKNPQLRRTSAVVNNVTGGFARIGQRIEDASRFSGNTVTFSFYNETVSTNNDESYISFKFESGAALQVQTPTTFETVGFKTFTVVLNSDAVLGDYLEVMIVLNKTTVKGSALVSQLKLERGAVSTPYQARPIGEELALCQRYYWKEDPMSRLATIYNSNTIARACWVDFPVTMRVAPAATFTGSGFSGLATAVPTTSGIRFSGAASSGVANTVVTNITADAEL